MPFLDLLFLACRWKSLEAAFAEIVETGGDMRAYRQRWLEGRWWWLNTATGIAYGGPNLEMTCRKAVKQGLIV